MSVPGGEGDTLAKMLMDYYETFTHLWSMIKLTSDQEQSGISKIGLLMLFQSQKNKNLLSVFLKDSRGIMI